LEKDVLVLQKNAQVFESSVLTVVFGKQIVKAAPELLATNPEFFRRVAESRIQHAVRFGNRETETDPELYADIAALQKEAQKIEQKVYKSAESIFEMHQGESFNVELS